MLAQLSIRNFAVIESVHVSFERGFQVLTGETGAGKSMIIDALSLIAGGRASSEWIRHGKEKAEIEASFHLEAGHPVWQTLSELGIESDPDELLIIHRELSTGGKSFARINGRLVNLSMLRQVGDWLVNIHGQHEHQSLLKTERHLQWLDLYGGDRLLHVKQQYADAYKIYRKLKNDWNELAQTDKEKLQMLDLYRFQIEEIEQAALISGEDELLEEEKHKLMHAEKLFQNVSEAYEQLYGDDRGLDRIGSSISHLESAAAIDQSELNPILEQLQSAYYQLEDAAYALRKYRDEVEFNPERLQQIEERLDLIYSLRRKYGDTVDEILQYGERVRNELEKIEHRDQRLSELEAEIQQLERQLAELADQLSSLRKEAARKLAQQIEQELADLHMERTSFEVHFERTPAFTSSGVDTAEFMISPNPGEPLRPLSKIASGGELSRIMLAMKTIFARMDRIPVLVFDEVDTGVSGRAAQAIAEKLAVLSDECQVFAITHLPQVACMADHHYEIRKQVVGDETFTKVIPLEGRSRILELARMLGGVEVTETTEHHAEEMLAMAAQIKEQRKHLQL